MIGFQRGTDFGDLFGLGQTFDAPDAGETCTSYLTHLGTSKVPVVCPPCCQNLFEKFPILKMKKGDPKAKAKPLRNSS